MSSRCSRASAWSASQSERGRACAARIPLHGRKRESAVAASPLQGFHQILAPISSEKAQNPEGFVLSTASGLHDPVEEPDGFCSQLSEALFTLGLDRMGNGLTRQETFEPHSGQEHYGGGQQYRETVRKGVGRQHRRLGEKVKQ